MKWQLVRFRTSLELLVWTSREIVERVFACTHIYFIFQLDWNSFSINFNNLANKLNLKLIKSDTLLTSEKHIFSRYVYLEILKIKHID